MSLFKARDWWKADCGNGEEEFDRGCLAVANVDNDPSGSQKLVSGSLHGTLRVFAPKERDFQVDDLLLEVQLGAPIIQVEAGAFTTNGGVSLAVLHPRKLVVYTVSPVTSAHGGAASHFALTKNYEHALEHTAANMCYGPFGGAHHDYICVQSMDGQISVFEHENIAFQRYLHNFLLPGPIAYVQRTDSFVTCNSAFEIECYKYQVLATSSADKQSRSDGVNAAKRVRVDWSVVIGEMASELQVTRVSHGLQRGQVDIVVMAERHIFCLSDIGELRWQKRLDYEPCAMHAYRARQDDQETAPCNLMIASKTGSIMIYQEVHLVWAAKCDACPLAMCVGSMGGVHGLTVTLSEEGVLGALFLGTDPPLSVVGAAEGKELNYEEMDDEHRRLLAIIREATSTTKTEPSDMVVIRAQVPNMLDRGAPNDDMYDDDGTSSGRAITVRLFVSYTGSSTLDDVHITVSAPPPLRCVQTSLAVPTLQGGNNSQPAVVPVTLVATGECLPASTKITVVAAFYTGMGEPRTATCEVELPLCLFVYTVPPQKSATYKITIETNRNPPHLAPLFEDVVTQSRGGNETMASGTNALNFEYLNGMQVTMIVSKNAGRYRLQSNDFDAMWLIAHELVTRLGRFYAAEEGGGGADPFTASFSEALPLQDFFNLLDQHFATRTELNAVRNALSERAHQFRAIQKRLLMRFKDKNPAPLGHLDTLLGGTFHQIVDMAAAQSQCHAELKQAANRLSCGCRLLLLLIKLRFGLDDERMLMLESYISPVVEDTAEQGWEEVTDLAVTVMLRTVLAKSAKETVDVVPPMQLLTDTSKLKKHISVAIERIARGGAAARE